MYFLNTSSSLFYNFFLNIWLNHLILPENPYLPQLKAKAKTFQMYLFWQEERFSVKHDLLYKTGTVIFTGKIIYFLL